MPKDLYNYLFPHSIDLFDFRGMRKEIEKKIKKDEFCVELYVTGATMAVVEVIKYCVDYSIPLVLMHYDKATGRYERQCVL